MEESLVSLVSQLVPVLRVGVDVWKSKREQER